MASELAAGGMGARPAKDGIDVVETDVTNCMNIPVEALEMNFPLRIGADRPLGGLRRRGRVPGRARAREGLRGDRRPTSPSPTGASASPRRRGASSAAARRAAARAFIVRRDGTREALPSKKMLVLHPGDQLWEYIAGGAGWGDPLERDADQVLADVLDRHGLGRGGAAPRTASCSPPGGAAVDHDATKECREALRRARGPIDWVFDRGGAADGREA